MFFANGDRAVTYQQSEVIDAAVLERLKNAFNKTAHVYLTDMITTEHTLTFIYEPVKIMEAHNTIEPYGIVVEEARNFLVEKGFLK
ncbi:hypothetical protein [Lacicoccus alkaliphilus]|uniref:Uncharacterized protein n=1 Tax=Lacicoccus alkaliphilus DSM 16010 TaxID=1123231 RepID=A0A1M7F720_9BACL|nr:hypothetical protein [Salinicoccus alkaliphilus]SHL99477.1 hypothetical protein SAMN02745189_01346 [Salinicoccus alkaliphilus DSM 16010]